MDIWDNCILRYLLTGKRITEEEYSSFKPVNYGCWSRRPDTLIDFHCRYLTPEEYEYNDINLSLLNYCYREIDKVSLELHPLIFQSLKYNDNPLNY